MMANRDRVQPVIQVAPKYVAKAIAQVREALDRADYSAPVIVAPTLGGNITIVEQCYAWMMAAMAIADLTEIDSMTLRSLQNDIWRGEQDVLFW